MMMITQKPDNRIKEKNEYICNKVLSTFFKKE